MRASQTFPRDLTCDSNICEAHKGRPERLLEVGDGVVGCWGEGTGSREKRLPEHTPSSHRASEDIRDRDLRI